MPLNFESFPGCCGAGVITNFHGTEIKLAEELLDYFYGDNSKPKKDMWGNTIYNRRPHGIEYVMLTNNQDSMYGQMLLDIGFTKVVDGVKNPNTNRHLVTYVFVANEIRNGVKIQPQENIRKDVTPNHKVDFKAIDNIPEDAKPKDGKEYIEKLKKVVLDRKAAEEERRKKNAATRAEQSRKAAETRAANRAAALAARAANQTRFTDTQGRERDVRYYLSNGW